MLPGCGRRLVLSLAGSMFTCLLVLVAEPGAERGAGAEVRSFSAYFSRLSRARREAPGGAGPRAEAGAGVGVTPPPAEELSARDVFIAVKTTRKFHRARLQLLLDTWISRHPGMVRARSPARAPGVCSAGLSRAKGPPMLLGVPPGGLSCAKGPPGLSLPRPSCCRVCPQLG